MPGPAERFACIQSSKRTSLGVLRNMIALSTLLLTVIVQQINGDPYNCSSAYQRYPVNNDITVICGPSSIFLSINVCPALFAMFDPLNLALNGKHNQSNCLGILDNSTSPPVVTYTFPLNDTTENACGNAIQLQEEAGSGMFNDFSKIQMVVISGFVDTPPSSDTGFISYSTNLYYNFSCHYPLQYLLNNTRLSTSSANVAVNTNNGSFISTLSMNLFLDPDMSTTLQQNGSALPLKTKVYVRIVATNLTTYFNVLLDHCFATPTALITSIPEEKYSFLTGCVTQDKTTVISNGNSKSAQFSFETFRFVQHNNQRTSAIFLHCITRLCQPQQCVQFLQGCNNGTNTTSSSRRKREALDSSSTSSQGTSSAVTVSSGPIYLATDDSPSSSGSDNPPSTGKPSGHSVTGLILGLVIAAILSTGLIVASLIMYKLYRLRAAHSQKEGLDNVGYNGK